MVTWFVVFEDVDDNAPARRFLRLALRPPRHCWAFRDTAAGMLVANLNIGFLELDCVPGLTAEAWAAHCRAKGLDVLSLSVTPNAHRWTPRLLTCVSVLRALFGWTGRLQTPRGLQLQILRSATT